MVKNVSFSLEMVIIAIVFINILFRDSNFCKDFYKKYGSATLIIVMACIKHIALLQLHIYVQLKHKLHSELNKMKLNADNPTYMHNLHF